jgi:hypothetical protein
MRRGLPLLLLTGCGVAFVVGDETDEIPGTSATTSTTVSTGAGGSSSSGGAATSAGGTAGFGGDGGAGGVAGPAWVVLETLTVPVDGSMVTSSMSLAMAGTYRLRASGTFVISTATNTLADAEYYDLGNPKDAGSFVDHGLAVDDPVVDLDRSPQWGAYAPSHVYQVDYAGTDAPIVAQFHDEVPSNNTGSLSLEILSFE